MTLQLKTKIVQDVKVVEAGGEIDLQNAPQLRAELLRACEGDRPCIVVDLCNVSFIDSTGIGVLVGALKRTREHNGNLVLVCPNPRVRRIFEITGLLSAIALYDTVDSAVAGCSASGARRVPPKKGDHDA